MVVQLREKLDIAENESAELQDLVNELQSKLSLSVEKSLLQSIHELRETLDNEVNRWSETESKATQTTSTQDVKSLVDDAEKLPSGVKSLDDFKKWVPIALSAERLALSRPLESVNALTLIMKGSWMWKCTRSGMKHLRFVSVNPLERMMSWTREEGEKANMKSGKYLCLIIRRLIFKTISTIHIVSIKRFLVATRLGVYNERGDFSLAIYSGDRRYVFIAQSYRDHQIWSIGLSMLLKQMSIIKSSTDITQIKVSDLN